MNITLILSILIFAVLVFIAAELYVIAREISRGITILIKERETHEGKSSGQTINVNVAPTGAGSGTQNVTPSAISTLGIQTESKNPAADDLELDEKRETEQQAAKPPQPQVKSTPSGSFAVKCSRCKAENSSYRQECFNCGEPL